MAILNAGHGSTAAMLLAGKPILQFPIWLEQGLLSRAVVRMGAGVEASHKDSEQVEMKLKAILDGDSYALRARQFAERYATFDAQAQRAGILVRVEQLLGLEAAG